MRARITGVAVFVVLCAVIGIPLLGWPAGRDQGIEGATAAAWLAGAIPYRDVWNHSLPGGFGVAALCQLFFGNSDVALRAFDLGLITLSALAIVSWLREHARPAIAWWTGAFFVLEYVGRGDFWQTTQRDGFLLAPMLWALWLARRRDSTRSAALAGALLGVAMLCKPGAGVALLAVVIWRRSNLRQVLAACACAVAPLLLFALWLSVHHAWAGFIDSVVSFNRGYAQLVGTSVAARLLALTWLIAKFLIPLRPELLASLLLIGVAPQLTAARRDVGVLIAVAAACPLLQAGAYPYHLLPLYGPLCIAIGLGLASLDQRLTASARVGARTARATIFVLCAALSCFPLSGWLRHASAASNDTDRASKLHRFDTPDFHAYDLEQTARYIAEHSKADARVQVWGPDAGLLLRASRASATRYPTYLPLVAPWTQAVERPRFMRALQQAPADFFVVQRTASPMLSGRRETPEALLASFPELHALLRTSYRVALQNPGFTLLQREH